MRAVTTLLVTLGLIAGGYAVTYKRAPEEKKVAVVSEAWVEINSGTVFLHSVGSAIPLKNGDTIASGLTLSTGKNSEATLHFPDGSVLRVDKETKITLDQFAYKTEDKSLIVAIEIGVGRVWSKVVGLATPGSSWEVKTSNTVATVRGTAFGMGSKNGKSWVLGSEHTVAVSPRDPITKEKIQGAEVLISEQKFLEISDEDVRQAKATTTPLLDKKVGTSTPTFTKDPWIIASQNEDKKFNAEIEKIKTETLPTKDSTWRDTLEKKNTESYGKVVPHSPEPTLYKAESTEKRIPSKDSSSDMKKVESSTGAPEKNSTKREVSQSEVGSSGNDTRSETSLLLSPSRDQTKITEGDTISYKVFLLTNDTKREVTKEVVLKVLGGIGEVSSSGQFTAKLSEEVSERGLAYGALVATFKNSSGTELIAKSEILTVTAKVDATTSNIGGQ